MKMVFYETKLENTYLNGRYVLLEYMKKLFSLKNADLQMPFFYEVKQYSSISNKLYEQDIWLNKVSNQHLNTVMLQVCIFFLYYILFFLGEKLFPWCKKNSRWDLEGSEIRFLHERGKFFSIITLKHDICYLECFIQIWINLFLAW